MAEEEHKQEDHAETEEVFQAKPVSRRDFLKIAGVAGATVGVAGGLGGLLAACGEEETTTTAGPTTTAAATTTTTAATTTTTAGPESGREIKVGVIAPVTGIYAVFAIADRWGLDVIGRYLGEEVVLGDGKKHKVSWLLRDTQSDINRASQVTADLILNDKADLLVVGGGPDTALPAADQCETLGAPLLATNCPWQAWVFGRGKTMEDQEKWVFGSLFGVEQATAGVVKVFDKISSNKVAALYFGNTADTQAWLAPGFGAVDTLEAAGYTIGPYELWNQGTEDYTSLISGYKRGGCEVQFGSNPGKDFSVYWQQALQQGFNPKCCIEVVGISSYEDQVALGDAAFGLVNGLTWHKSWPYTDVHISGMTNAELADDYEDVIGTPWNFSITHYARMGWAVDVLKRTKDLDDKESILEAIKTTNTELVTGKIDMTSPVDPAGLHFMPNIHKQPWGFVQLQPGTKWKIEMALVAMVDADVPVDRDPQPIQY